MAVVGVQFDMQHVTLGHDQLLVAEQLVERVWMARVTHLDAIFAFAEVAVRLS